MHALTAGLPRVFLGLAAAFLCSAGHAQVRVNCPDGEHVRIDWQQIAIQYQATAFSGTLNGLAAFAGGLKIEPKTLQIATAATQQWDEYLKGLVAGYNGCAITKQQYQEGLNRIYPRLREDAQELEALRALLSQQKAVDTKRLESLLKSYEAQLRRFAELAGKSIDYERIESIVVAELRPVREGQDVLIKQNEEILQKLHQIAERQNSAPLATPEEVKPQISALKQQMLAKVDEAEVAYNTGYELTRRFRYRESLPYFSEALSIIRLPEFLFALSSAHFNMGTLDTAEGLAREGATLVSSDANERKQIQFNNLLALILRARGNTNAALRHARLALSMAKQLFGPDAPILATLASNIGQILQDKGQLVGALSYTQRALEIDEKVYGLEHHNVAIRANNIALILFEQGDLNRALQYAKRALAIDEKVYGLEHHSIAVRANTIGVILYRQGDMDDALRYAQRALAIDEKASGPDHPFVAIRANNIATILIAQGSFDEAMSYAQHALSIDERTFSANSLAVARDYNTIAGILKDKGDLDEAVRYARRAFEIAKDVVGVDDPTTQRLEENLGALEGSRR